MPNTTRHPKPVLGLLGAPGSGKSTVARLFAELGCGVIDADRLAHDALREPAVRDQLVSWWGDAVINADGEIDRPAVGRIVFNAPAQLKQLESFIHPLVHAGRRALRQQMNADPAVRAVIEDCPLLLETGLDGGCDALVWIDCPFEARLERLARTRGWDEAELRKREGRQLPLDIKRSKADYVISNGQDLRHAREQVARVLQQAVDHHPPA